MIDGEFGGNMLQYNICVTGGAGFIGSHFVNFVHKKMGEKAKIIVYDKLTYAADLSRIKGSDVIVVEGDICNASHFLETLRRYSITHIVNFAAESHVDRSLTDDMPFIQTNILGTANVIECATRFWSDASEGFRGKKLIHISTDEVYGSVLLEQLPATEQSVLNPSNPYAATKAAADQLVIGKMRSDGLPALILRSSNVFGKDQNPEKFIPKTFQAIKENKPIIVYGKGEQMRRWLDATTYSEIIWLLLSSPVVGEIFNIPGKEDFTNLELVQLIRAIYKEETKRESSEIQFTTDRKNHDFCYHISGEKLERWLVTLDKNIEYRKISDFIAREVKKS